MGCLQSENFAQTIARATYARNPRSALALLTIFRKTVAACDPQIAAVHAAKPNEVHGCGKPIVAHLTDSENQLLVANQPMPELDRAEELLVLCWCL